MQITLRGLGSAVIPRHYVTNTIARCQGGLTLPLKTLFCAINCSFVLELGNDRSFLDEGGVCACGSHSQSGHLW
jgi:hypothetical protein